MADGSDKVYAAISAVIKPVSTQGMHRWHNAGTEVFLFFRKLGIPLATKAGPLKEP